MEQIVEKFPEQSLALDMQGVIGDRFYGATRFSKSRQATIPNERMWSAVSLEDVAFVLAYWNKLLRDKGADGQLGRLEISWFGPNICFRGMDKAITPSVEIANNKGQTIRITWGDDTPIGDFVQNNDRIELVKSYDSY